MTSSKHNSQLKGVQNSKPDNVALLIEAIKHALEEVRFGSIEITIHEGKVTQIERREKIRFQS